MDRRLSTIINILPNLYRRWPDLTRFPADAVAELYENFSLSDEFGNNDERFPEWFDQLPPLYAVNEHNQRWLADRFLTPLTHYADGLITRDELRGRLCREIDRPHGDSRNGAVLADEHLGTTD